MEFFVGLILVIVMVALIVFFKRPIKKVSRYTDDIFTTYVSENQGDLIKRSQIAYDNLVKECGEGYMTPQEIYNKMIRKTVVNPVTNKKK